MANFKRFLTQCADCGNNTSKSFARANSGKCKACVTGIEPEYRGPKCPQCDAPISAYKARHRYVCESCVQENDPIGYYNEVMGRND
jgi:hypothetical protein